MVWQIAHSTQIAHSLLQSVGHRLPTLRFICSANRLLMHLTDSLGLLLHLTCSCSTWNQLASYDCIFSPT